MINVIIGTRAQLIKMAPVLRYFNQQKQAYQLVFTGQHSRSINETLNYFQLKNPDIILYSGPEVKRIWQAPIWFLLSLFKAWKLRRQLFFQPDGVVLIHGDTFSTLLGAIIGKLGGQTVVHIEAGLRSFNYLQPFPEEMTRVLVSKLSDIHFCPNAQAVKNLSNAGGEKINIRKNTLLDSLRYYLLHNKLSDKNLVLKKTDTKPRLLKDNKYLVCSIHRFENIFIARRLIVLLKLLINLSSKYKILFILHPPTKARLIKLDLLQKLTSLPNFHFLERQDYPIFLRLVSSAEFVITDGGSNQEECSYLGVPCLLYRSATERPEGIGQNVVLSKYDSKIINKFLDNYSQYRYQGVLDSENSEKSQDISTAKAKNTPALLLLQDASPSKLIGRYLIKHNNKNRIE